MKAVRELRALRARLRLRLPAHRALHVAQAADGPRATTRSTPRPSSSTSPSRRRSATPVRCFPSETGRPIYIDEVALDFPELRIVCGHIGWPWTEEMIAVAWKHRNVWIDTSAHVPKHYPPAFVHFMKTFGKDKVCFATDYPLLQWDRVLEGGRRPRAVARGAAALPARQRARARSSCRRDARSDVLDSGPRRSWCASRLSGSESRCTQGV